MPGIRFTRGNFINDAWREHIEFMSGQGGPCLPDIYLDGAQLISEQDRPRRDRQSGIGAPHRGVLPGHRDSRGVRVEPDVRRVGHLDRAAPAK